MQIKRLAMYEFNKPKIACNKCRDNKTNVQFNVIGRLEKLIQSEFKGNIPQSRSSTNFFAHTDTNNRANKKKLQTFANEKKISHIWLYQYMQCISAKIGCRPVEILSWRFFGCCWSCI